MSRFVIVLIIFLFDLVYLYSQDVFVSNSSAEQLFQDLQQIEEINQEISDQLPLIYNANLLRGLITMPSARMSAEGMMAFGFSYLPPYRVYSVHFQPLSRVEVSGNYHVFHGQTESCFGHLGYGDDADRAVNVKLALLKQQDGILWAPELAVGWNDFMGSRRFYSFYLVSTKEWSRGNLEMSVGWGKGRIDGFFGGVIWSPWRRLQLPFLKDLSLIAEYDANNYKDHVHEHPEGRCSKSPINIGFATTFRELLQLKVFSLRGKEIAAQASLQYNFGTTQGLFPKVQDPKMYRAPVNFEPLGSLRSESELAHELAFAFKRQGLNLYRVYLTFDQEGNQVLWIRMMNILYRRQSDVRKRLTHVFASLLPENISKVIVQIEADGVPVYELNFRRRDLKRYHEEQMDAYEMKTLSPKKAPQSLPSSYEGHLLYKRKKDIWTLTIRPSLLTFFGSTNGKFKYSLGLIAGPQGYLFDQVYYQLQGRYSAFSSLSDVGSMDRYNPSQLLNVRSDEVKYFQRNTFSLEKAYLQKGWYLGNNWYLRAATGYFEAMYGGVALETLYYPLHRNVSFGFSGATVLKRKYHGLGFMHKIRKLDGFTPKYVPYIGYQYFLNLYYTFKPLSLDFSANVGQFLARDKGVKFQIGKYYPSGLRFSLWYTLTSKKDIVNGKRYYDKGICFEVPLDLFLAKSSRTFVQNCMAAWLRDVGAMSQTGIPLYDTLRLENQ